jgi:hypothetical protein
MSESFVHEIVHGSLVLPPPIDDLDAVIKKDRAYLKKAEVSENLIRMRLKLGLLSSKEYEDKMSFLS